MPLIYPSRLLLTILVVVTAVVGGVSIKLEAAETQVQAIVEIAPNNIQKPNIILSSESISSANLITFSSSSLKLASGETITEAECTFTTTLATNEIVKIKTTANSSGVCSYSTQQGQENYQIIEGDPQKINIIPGVHTVALEVKAINQTVSADNKQYTVTNPQLEVPSFVVDKKTITPGESVIATTQPVKLNDGTIVSSAPATITFILPNKEKIVLKGTTNSEGKIVFNSSTPLEKQGLSLVSGSIQNLTKLTGTVSGYVEINYQGAVYKTNIDSFSVIAAPDLPRTGGAVGVGLILLITVVISMYIVSKDRTTN